MPRLAPMLAQVGTESDLGRAEHLFEPKLDGTRALCLVVGTELKLVNRRGRELTSRYPEFADLRKHILAESCVLDGEIIVYDTEAKPSFTLLQRREHVQSPTDIEQRSKEHPATYVVFDILMKDSEDLTGLPLIERKAVLHKTVRPGRRIERMFTTNNGRGLWQEVKARALEGVMAKPLASHYYPGERPPVWLKIKYLKRLDAVIVGYTSEKRAISALVMAHCREGAWQAIGRVGTGFTDELLADLAARLRPLKRRIPPTGLRANGTAAVQWVRPELVAEIEYLELTKSGTMRAPSFIRLRDDKSAEECAA